MALDLEFPLVQDWSLGLHYGVEEFSLPAGSTDEDSDEDTSFTLSKGDMSFTVSVMRATTPAPSSAGARAFKV